VNLGQFNKVVALGIASLKATLVVLYFMHVKYASRLTKLIVVTGFFFLAILLTLTMADYGSRGWGQVPPMMQ
jgi:cytochrome c oxidase subunit 4